MGMKAAGQRQLSPLKAIALFGESFPILSHGSRFKSG